MKRIGSIYSRDLEKVTMDKLKRLVIVQEVNFTNDIISINIRPYEYDLSCMPRVPQLYANVA